jgi:hypothetical protein
LSNPILEKVNRLELPDQRGSPDRPFNIGRWTDHPAFAEPLKRIVADIEAKEIRAGERVNHRSKAAHKAFTDAVRIIVCDLHVAWHNHPGTTVGIGLSKSDALDAQQYKQLSITWRTFNPALKGLQDLGYVRIVKRGYFDVDLNEGLVTRFQATNKLIDQLARIPFTLIGYDIRSSAVILKDKDRKVVPYKETASIRKMVARLRRINSNLSRHWIDLKISDQALRRLKALPLDEKDVEFKSPQCFSERHLQRNFRPDFDRGGRFYGGWWQNIPKVFRQLITINGEETIELDFATLHPTMLYAKAGHPMTGDAYNLDNLGCNVPRAVIKEAFQKLLNAKPKQRIAEIKFDWVQAGTDWQGLLEKIKIRHAPIAHWFRSGVGSYLQKEDAAITEQVMLHFAARNIPCLPIHDSFIVPRHMEDDLRAIMDSSFRDATGQSCEIKRTKFPPLNEYDLVVSKDAASYEGYKSREQEWADYLAARSQLRRGTIARTLPVIS